MKPTTIDTYRRVINLLFMGRTQREIANICKVSTKTIAKINNEIRNHKMNKAIVQEMEDEQLAAIFFPVKAGVTRKGMILPDSAFIRKKIILEGKNKKEVWSEYVSANDGKTMKYTQFCTYLKENEEKLRLRTLYRPGSKMILMWCSRRARVVDQDTGEVRESPVIAAVWPYSECAFITCVENRDFESWLDGAVTLLTYAGCVPHKIIPYSYRGIYSKGNSMQEQLITFARHYGCSIDIDCSKQFKDIVKKVDQIASKMLDKEIFLKKEEVDGILPIQPDSAEQGFSAYELFRSRECVEGYLLPEQEFEVVRWKQAKVQYMYHISIAKRYYSVPWEYIGETVDVKITRKAITIFYAGKQLAEHARLYKKNEWYSTVVDHMPPKGADVYWNGDWFITRARKIGPDTCKVIQVNLNMKPIEQQMYYDCRMILMLAEKYSPELLETACNTTLQNHIIPWKKEIMKKLDEIVPTH